MLLKFLHFHFIFVPYRKLRFFIVLSETRKIDIFKAGLNNARNEMLKFSDCMEPFEVFKVIFEKMIKSINAILTTDQACTQYALPW